MISRTGVVPLAAVVVWAAVAVPSPVAEAAPGVRVAAPVAVRMAVNRVVDTVLSGERYDYRRENWRITEATGLPRWVRLRHGRLTGTAPGLGRWRVVLDERGVGKQRGEQRRTVVVLKAVTERAAPGTLLLTRGIDGRPANAASTNVTVSGDGSTVVFSSYATNLVPGTVSSVGRLYVWDSASQQVSLVHPEAWAVLKGVSADGQRLLVQLSPGLFLIDRTDGTGTLVAQRTAGAALTADGERVLFQDPPGSVPARLVEWTRATGATRIVVADLQSRSFAGLSPDGRFALFSGGNDSELLDTSTGAFRGAGRTGLEGGFPSWVDVSDNGALVSVRGVGVAAGHGHGGDPVAGVRDTLLGTPVGPSRNFGTAITADGTTLRRRHTDPPPPPGRPGHRHAYVAVHRPAERSGDLGVPGRRRLPRGVRQ